MPEITLLQNGFFSGEITERLSGQISSLAYQTGAEKMFNFVPMRTGGFRPRPGTRYAEDLSNQSRLIPFYDTDGAPYVLVFENTAVKVIDTSTNAFVSGVSLTAPWATAELYEIQYAGLGGEVWCAHRGATTRKITLTSGPTWGISAPTFTGDRTFAAAGDYPGVIAFISGRLFVGSTDNEPLALFGSQIPTAASGATNYLGFDFGTGTAADAIYLLENDMGAKRLAWLGVAGRILAGTNRSVWMSDGNIPTPSTFDLVLTSRNGAAEIQPKAYGNMLLYVSQDRKSLRALSYSLEGGGYRDIDLSEQASHLLTGKIKDFDIMLNPEPIVWIMLDDGTLVSATLRYTENGIMGGFAEHALGGSGLVESLCVIHKEARDELWLAVNRDGTRTAEYLYFEDIDTTAIEDCFFVDCGVTVENTPASATVSGLTHLNGLEVVALGDGGVLPAKTVASGEVTYDSEVEKAQVGLEYTPQFRNLRPELPANGTSQGKLKVINRVTLRTYRSSGGSIGTNPEQLKDILYERYNDYEYDSELNLYTGDQELSLSGKVDTRGQLYIYQRSPLPLNVLAIITRYKIMEA